MVSRLAMIIAPERSRAEQGLYIDPSVVVDIITCMGGWVEKKKNLLKSGSWRRKNTKEGEEEGVCGGNSAATVYKKAADMWRPNPVVQLQQQQQQLVKGALSNW